MCIRDSAYTVFLEHVSDLRTEEFWVIFLNQKNQIIYKSQISKGGITGTIVAVSYTHLDVYKRQN